MLAYECSPYWKIRYSSLRSAHLKYNCITYVLRRFASYLTILNWYQVWTDIKTRLISETPITFTSNLKNIQIMLKLFPWLNIITSEDCKKTIYYFFFQRLSFWQQKCSCHFHRLYTIRYVMCIFQRNIISGIHTKLDRFTIKYLNIESYGTTTSKLV